MAVLDRRARFSGRMEGIRARWRTAAARLGGHLLAVYVALTGAAAGALLADQLVRSMWRHAIFTGVHQWRTSAFTLTLLWIVIGAVAAVVMLGPAGEDEDAAADDL